MSKIGRKKISFSENVKVNQNSSILNIIGPKGKLSILVPKFILITISENSIFVKPCLINKYYRKYWGMFRSLISNMIEGVNIGFCKRLKIFGIGYKAIVKDNILIISLGFCHDIGYVIPTNISINCKKDIIYISGIDKQKVGHVASEIRSLRKSDPYKGKGIIYEDEIIIRKQGKKK